MAGTQNWYNVSFRFGTPLGLEVTGLDHQEIAEGLARAFNIQYLDRLTVAREDLDSDPPTRAVTSADAETYRRRVQKAIGVLTRWGQLPGQSHHQSWIIDQMARALTGCPMTVKTGIAHDGLEYSYEAQVENGAYRQLIDDEADWTEGIAP